MKEKGDVLMPQLNKGGKFVFGLSLIHDDLTVQFPTQASLKELIKVAKLIE